MCASGRHLDEVTPPTGGARCVAMDCYVETGFSHPHRQGLMAASVLLAGRVENADFLFAALTNEIASSNLRSRHKGI